MDEHSHWLDRFPPQLEEPVVEPSIATGVIPGLTASDDHGNENSLPVERLDDHLDQPNICDGDYNDVSSELVAWDGSNPRTQGCV